MRAGLTPEELKSAAERMFGLVIPVIVGSVDYQSTVGEVHHQTPFMFDLRRIAPDGTGRALVAMQDYPREELAINPKYWGRGEAPD